MLYVTYSEGFKSGGFTQRVFPPQPTVPSFEPEFVDVYEGGFKWDGADGRVRLNGAAFFTDYTDLQIISQAETVAPIVLNAGEAEVKGFELDLQAVPVNNILLEAGVGYVDAEYTELDPGTGLTLENELVKTPEWTGVAALSYTWDWAGVGSIIPRVDFSYRDSYYSNAINSRPTWQDSFTLWNLGVTFESDDGKWLVTAIGRNLGDERFISAGYSEENGPTLNLGISEVVQDRGREFVLTVRRSFF